MIERFAWRPVAGVVGVQAGLLVATAPRYGYHRDELYFLAAGKRLAWGYDDQPPLTPLLARTMAVLVPDSLVALRLPAILAAVVAAVMVALIAREMGGKASAQTMACGAAALSPVVVLGGHWLSTTIIDFMFCTLITLCLARWIRIRRDGLLLAAGLVCAVGLLNKALLALVLAAVVLAVAWCGPKEIFSRPLFWVGVLIAMAAWLPYLLWQARHGLPQLHMAEAIRASFPVLGGRPIILATQPVLIGLAFSPFAVLGIIRLIRSGFRCLAVGYLVLLGLLLLTGGINYYAAGAFPAVLAAGAVAGTDWLARQPARLAGRLAASGVAVSLGIALALLPCCPERLLPSWPARLVSRDADQQIGWPESVRAIAEVYWSLPQAERETSVIFAGNYGLAGAVELFGSRHGLPAPYSGYNAYWRWGPPPDRMSGPAIVAGPYIEAKFTGICEIMTPLRQIGNDVSLDTEEYGSWVWLCRGMRQPWSQVWPRLRHLGVFNHDALAPSHAGRGDAP